MIKRQAAFNAVVRGMLKQRQFSMMGGSCMYRGLNDTRCAIGMLIPNDRYDPNYEGGNVYDVRICKTISTRYIPNPAEISHSDLSFLEDMQEKLHDALAPSGRFSKPVFRHAAAAFAARHNLKVDVNLFK